MLRPFYRCVLCLHPRAFRQRFADEMLSIFDHTAGKPAAIRLLADGLISLARQWTLRPEFWHEHELSPSQQPAPDGIPSFYTLDPFRPRAGAVIHGLVLSTLVFCLTCFAIRYSWIHVLHVRIPEVQFESPPSIPVNPSIVASAGPEKPTVPARSENQASVTPSAAPQSAVKVSAQAPPAPTATRDHIALKPGVRSSAAGRSQSRVSSDAQPAVGVAGQPTGQLAQESAMSSDLQSNLLPVPDRLRPQPQAQQPKAQDATREIVSEIVPEIVSTVVADVKLDAAARQRVIQGAAANLTKYYVDPNAAKKMADALRAHEKNGDDDATTDGKAFADLLTRQMMDVSHDKYVTMVYSTVTTPENPPAPTAKEVALYRKEMLESNCTFEKVKILPHNIAYVKFNKFPDASICGTTVASAMASLNHADAIIFDLRDNRGGYSNMVALVATYLFDRPTHLNDFYNRGENSTEQSWTLPPVPGNRLADKPAFVLTSPTTFSAAEGFSYDLKMLKRATLVGETTSGRGHMGMGHRIDDHFTIRVPGIRVVNPISKTNWEGTGVEPDVKVKAADALATAQRLAEMKLRQK